MFESNIKLNQLATVIDCEHKTAPTVDDGIPLIRTPDIDRGRLKSHQARRVTEKTFAQWTRRAIPEPGDLIMAREAPVGNVGLVRRGERVCLGQRTVLIQPDRGKVCPEYLNYVFSTDALHAYMNMLATGATVGHLNVGDIRKLSLPEFPPIGAQEKIAAILTAYDDLVENNRQRIALLEKMAEEIYREWFVRLRFPGHEHTPVHKGVPEGWEVHRMRDLISYYIGGGWGEELQSTEFSDPAFVIRGTDLPGVSVGDISTVPHRHHKPSNLRSRKLVEGDIVFEVSGGSKDQLLGRTAVMSREVIERFDNRVMCASFCKLIRPNNSLIRPVFLGQFLKLYYSTGLVGTFQVQSTGISNYQFEAFLTAQTLLVPPADLQARYSEIAETCSKQIDILAAQSHKLVETRDLLLNRLISGKLRVDDLDIQFPPSMQEDAA